MKPSPEDIDDYGIRGTRDGEGDPLPFDHVFHYDDDCDDDDCEVMEHWHKVAIAPLTIGEAQEYERKFTEEELELAEAKTVIGDRIVEPDLDLDDMTLDEVEGYADAVLDSLVEGRDPEEIEQLEKEIEERREAAQGNLTPSNSTPRS